MLLVKLTLHARQRDYLEKSGERGGKTQLPESRPNMNVEDLSSTILYGEKSTQSTLLAVGCVAKTWIARQ
jgi:hypothetical protein